MSLLVVVLTLALAAGGGVLLVPIVLRAAQGTGAVSATRVQAVLRGGLVIGLLERLATAGCVLLGQPEGIAVVVAVKGLGRYPELRGSASTSGAANAPSASGEPSVAALGAAVSERFIIGTLTSLIWAVAVGALGRWLLLTGV
ncbi:hypothetical protein [Serinibacter arcticus]|uniref:Uncharacterized protein n=1 Tax=Serinibacter arcticus TaxID=1655435 RepID=A0A4Z1DYX7_9MICO|nr:hypothetical protein [Serinibacter arcticus]TGO04726.1 hypothetical protein SERN_2319 [Serinibacter arcticus]